MNTLAELPLAADAHGVRAPIEVRAPAAQRVPFVFASPHSGRDYPPDLLAATRLDALTLRRSEDCYVDELFSPAPTHGAPLLLAHFPRAYCDVNRDPAELDPAIFQEAPPATPQTRSPRVHAGLGVIARVVRDGAEIYHRRLPLAEGARRVSALHRPYHAALGALLTDTKARFGAAVLIDCHSMPSQAAASVSRVTPPDIILGDRYGASCAAALTQHAETVLKFLGFSVGRNNPYAGGYTAEHYGAPAVGQHALQIEINRGLYLDEDRLEKRAAAFETLKARLERFIAALIAFSPVSNR